MKLEDIVNGAIGPFENYCDGYGNPGSSGLGYISVLTLETGKVQKHLDHELESIVAYDRAETKGTYIGQINMIQASSFSGLNGVVWGYHLAKAYKLESAKPLWEESCRNNMPVPVYDCEPLLNAGKRLFGTSDKKRFPLLPGAHVICAVKSIQKSGPCYVWCAVALAVAEDRETAANVFVEDIGCLEKPKNPDQHGQAVLKKMAASVMLVSKNQNIRYKEIFVGYKYEWMEENEMGCALVAAPYVVLAKRAVPPSSPALIINMTISEWERAVGFTK